MGPVAHSKPGNGLRVTRGEQRSNFALLHGEADALGGVVVEAINGDEGSLMLSRGQRRRHIQLIFQILADFFPVDPQLHASRNPVPGNACRFEGEGRTHGLTIEGSADMHAQGICFGRIPVDAPRLYSLTQTRPDCAGTKRSGPDMQPTLKNGFPVVS
jgi:hypothetical protein